MKVGDYVIANSNVNSIWIITGDIGVINCSSKSGAWVIWLSANLITRSTAQFHNNENATLIDKKDIDKIKF